MLHLERAVRNPDLAIRNEGSDMHAQAWKRPGDALVRKFNADLDFLITVGRGDQPVMHITGLTLAGCADNGCSGHRLRLGLALRGSRVRFLLRGRGGLGLDVGRGVDGLQRRN